MIKKSSFSYVNVLAHLALLLLFLCFNHIEKQVMPYSVALYSSAVAIGTNPIVCSLLLILSFVLSGANGMLGSIGIVCLFYCILSFIFKKNHKDHQNLFCALTGLSLIGFILLGDLNNQILLERRIVFTLLCCMLAFFTYNCLVCIGKKGLKYKLTYDEHASLIVVVAVIGLGICNFISPLFWAGICAFIIPVCCYLFKFGSTVLISAVLGISLSIYYGNVGFVSVCLLWGICAQAIIKVNRYLSSLSIILIDFIVQLIFSVYPTYSLINSLCLGVGSIVFCIIPTNFLANLKEKIQAFNEKQLVRQTINRNRIMLSNRLYELSGVFAEMKQAFETFKQKQMSGETAKNIIVKQTLSSVCDGCEKNLNCKKQKDTRQQGLEKIVNIGFAKGKLSLIDLPRDLSELCTKPSELLYYVNKLLADYRAYCIEKKNVSVGRDLLAMEAEGISQILKNLALESGATLKYQSKIEKIITNNLLKNGFIVNELLVFGEGVNFCISLVISGEQFSFDGITRLIGKTVGFDVILCEKIEISQGKIYLVYKKRAPFDAVFGISRAVKQGSQTSGDTHSIIKISEDKFLVALSDGMGSGEQAEKISSVALSLIESFYKAGLSGEVILTTVNKLLAINTEDSFTAIDISVIDLNTCQADFIKYGSPYGFIVSENGVRIIEGNSLPLGILDDLRPSVCKTKIDQDGIIVLITDGISDAFGSSGEIIDYLRSVPARNPQTLTDGLLAKALSLNQNTPNDDMTALAVRVFKKQSAI
ncbi:MAG: SpoIIE family protein phosphatase [Clostridia bacterium]|nr:SpoIIE family protein phosphatase [Clostridia bacterium]